MNHLRQLARAALFLTCLNSAAAAADGATDPGRRIFERRCTGCHQGTQSGGSTLGPNLAGLIGRKAGSEDTGVHSRAALDSDTVWTRSSLRRYLGDPKREMPGTIMSEPMLNPKELDDLLNYLETLR